MFVFRFPDSPQKICFFVIYLPLGIVLTVLRTLLGILIFIVGHILPDAHIIRNVLSRLLCFTFGVVVTVENPDKREDVEAFISNQISIFDHLVVHSATDSVTVGILFITLIVCLKLNFLAWSQVELIAFFNFWYTKFWVC